MMKKAQTKWILDQHLPTGNKLFTVLLLLLCFNTIFGQIYISEGATLIVENKAFICEKAGPRITESFPEIHITKNSLHVEIQTKVFPLTYRIKAERKNPKLEVKENKAAEVPSCNFLQEADQHFTSFKKNGAFVMIPVQNPTLLASFQNVAWLDKYFAFFEALSPQKLLEQYKNRSLYSSSGIRSPPSDT